MAQNAASRGADSVSAYDSPKDPSHLASLWALSPESFHVITQRAVLPPWHGAIRLLSDTEDPALTHEIRRTVTIPRGRAQVWASLGELFGSERTLGWPILDAELRREIARGTPRPSLFRREKVIAGELATWVAERVRVTDAVVFERSVVEFHLDEGESDTDTQLRSSLKIGAQRGATESLRRHALRLLDFVLPWHQIRSVAERAQTAVPAEESASTTPVIPQVDGETGFFSNREFTGSGSAAELPRDRD